MNASILTNRRNLGTGHGYRLLISLGLFAGKKPSFSEFETILSYLIFKDGKRLSSGVFFRQMKNLVFSQSLIGAGLL